MVIRLYLVVGMDDVVDMETTTVVKNQAYLQKAQELREIKREMKLNSVRVVSCFNGGLTQDEYYYNKTLFRLKAELSLLPREVAQPI